MGTKRASMLTVTRRDALKDLAGRGRRPDTAGPEQFNSRIDQAALDLESPIRFPETRNRPDGRSTVVTGSGDFTGSSPRLIKK